jgi:S-adenosylmethionine:tRNA ribosyltransferase-isomerase
MQLDDFDYPLPERLIATRPVRPRRAARLLVVTPDRLDDRHVFDLPRLLRPGDRLVLNNTRVIPARLAGTRTRGAAAAAVEVTLLQPAAAGGWQALARPLRRLRQGDTIRFSDRLSAAVAERGTAEVRLMFSLEGAAFGAALAEAGRMPLPPYIAARRAPDAADRDDYQSVFARRDGAVAAPTASLHFDAELLAELDAAGIARSEVTLHVGAGTFLPVKVADVTTHRMHAEWGEITPAAAAEIAATRAAGGRIVAVGTTALRLIESAADGRGGVRPWTGPTDIFIYPGFRFRVADALLTNFHLPKSTLLMLVAALMGRERILAAYAHAVAGGYRFFSYGDASLLVPGGR